MALKDKKIPEDAWDYPDLFIPKGFYCYDYIDGEFYLCPFWNIDNEKPEQENGYCHFMGKGDWELNSIALLWDQCKECDVNREGGYCNEIS